MRIKKYQSGFTLIELMIVVAVVGVLSLIAYPSYKEHVAKSRRAQAKATVAMAQQWMERFYSENYSYYTIRGTNKTVADIFPSNLLKSPPETSSQAQFNIVIASAANSPETYTITAQRVSTGVMKDDPCGDFTVDNYGRKFAKNFTTSRFQSEKAALDSCWQ